jgi:hypothetical protein
MAADSKTHQLAGSLIAEAVNSAIAQAQMKVKEAMDAEAKRILGLRACCPTLGRCWDEAGRLGAPGTLGKLSDWGACCEGVEPGHFFLKREHVEPTT